MRRVLWIFLLLNVVALAVGFVVTSRCLHFLSLTVDSHEPVTFLTSVSHGVLGFDGTGTETVTGVLPTDIDGDVVLRRRGDSSSAKLVRASLSSHVVLSRVWDGDELVPDEDGGIRLRDERAHWGVCDWFWTVFSVFEAFLFLFTVFIWWLSRDDKKGRCLDSVVMAFAGASLAVVIIPLQTLLGNPDSFQIALVDLLFDLLPRAFCVLCVLFAILEVGRRVAGQFMAGLLVTLLVYEYLEVGILSIGCPPLDGDAIAYKDIARGVIDGVVLLVLLVVLSLFRNTRVPVWTAVVVVILSTCSLFDSRTSTRVSFRSDIVDRPTENETVIRSTVYSPKKNVLLQFLDCTSTAHVLDVMSRSAELREAFDGFYFCTNNVGMYDTTRDSVPAIMTGAYHEVGDNAFVQDMFSSPSVIAPYVARGAKVMLAPGFLNFGYTTDALRRDCDESSKIEGQRVSPLFRRMADQQQWNIYEISKFRMSPFALKYYIYGLIVYGWSSFEGCAEESWTFPIVAESPIDDQCDLTFHSYHTIGAHPPYGTNRNGEFDPALTIGYRSKVEKTWYALAQSAKLFNRLKDRRLYDNHFMVFLADHGGEPMSPENCAGPTDAPSRAFPFLMFKPRGARGPLRFVGAPTSHSGVADVIRSLAERDLDAFETIGLLTRSNRVYRTRNGVTWYEYRFGSACYGAYDRVKLNGEAVSSPIELNHEYRFEHVRDMPPMEVRDEGEEGMLYEGIRLNTPMRTYILRTNVPGETYVVEIVAWMRIQKNTGDTDKCRWIVKDVVSGNRAEVLKHGDQREIKKIALQVRADEQGRICFSLVNTGFFGLMSLRVTK